MQYAHTEFSWRLIVAYKMIWREVQHSRLRVTDRQTAVRLQDWTGLEEFKRMRLPDFKTVGT
jgi:hypothetical protein